MSEIKERQVRMRAIIGARAVFNEGRSTLDCRIRNFSESGAKLELISSIGLPDIFMLEIPSRDQIRRVEVRWRSATAVGVQFSDAPLAR